MQTQAERDLGKLQTQTLKQARNWMCDEEAVLTGGFADSNNSEVNALI